MIPTSFAVKSTTFKEGLNAGWPICLGYLPIGMAFGVLAVYLRAAHRELLALYAYGVTDESFAVNLPRFNAGNWSLPRALVVNHAANLTWFISSQRFAVASPHPRRGYQTSRLSAAGVVGGPADVRFCLVDTIIGRYGGSGDAAILVG